MSFFPSEGNGGIFAQGAFTIDPNSTPEMIQAKRAQLAALMPQYGRAKYVGEGIGQLATGIATGRKNRALDKFEGERRAEAAGAFNNLMTGQGSATPRSSGPLSILGLRAPEQNANDAKYPVGQEGPAPRGNIDPASGLNMGQEVGGYRQSLIGTESGGNWAAQNSEIGAGGKPGHFGRVQFGQARLQDAMNAGAIPQGVTPEQFMASPELQMAAEDWHFADLENQLGDLVGSRVNGQVLDMGALVAMGHLGGAGGARKFVESGGRYNPSDAYGTSLADYANTHGGGGSFAPGAGTQVAQAGGPALNDLMMAAQNPWLTPQQKSIINSQIEQVQRQQTRAQDRQWAQQDPLYQLKLQQAQLDLEQDRAGTGANMPSAVQELQWRAQAAGLQQGTPEYQSFVLNGGGDPATFRALHMQAEAAGLQEGTPAYAEFMATRGAGLQAGARVTAENLADTATAGDAERVKAQGAAQGKASVEKGSELAEMERNMPGLLQVAEELNGLAEEATYTWAGQLLNEGRKQLGLEPSEGALARSKYIAVVDNQVLPLLRQTFGAAFTAKEGDTLRATLGDPDKSPSEKKAVLQAFIEQKKRDLISRGGSVPSNTPAAPSAFSQMGIADLNQVDIGGLDAAGMDAWEARMQELGY